MPFFLYVAVLCCHKGPLDDFKLLFKRFPWDWRSSWNSPRKSPFNVLPMFMKTVSFPSSFPSLHTQLNKSLSMQTTQHLSTHLLLSPLSRFPLWIAPFKPNVFQPSVPSAPKLSICRNPITLSIWYIRHNSKIQATLPTFKLSSKLKQWLEHPFTTWKHNPHRVTDLYYLSPYVRSLKTRQATLSSSFVRNSQHLESRLIHSLVTKYAYMFSSVEDFRLSVDLLRPVSPYAT